VNCKTLCGFALAAVLLGMPLHAETARKVTGQRRFNISYEVDENLAGLSSVELWVTTDGGQNYKFWGRDEDCVPPIVFEAPEDGTYGFVIIATDKAGNREPTPTTGTAPEAVAVVDTTAPLVRIDSPVGGEIFGPGTNLEVRWTATDANFGDRPVDVMLSSDAGNTWTSVAQSLPNSGSTIVPLPGAAAERYLVKVVARDLAGNVGQAVTATPVVLDGRAPQVKLTGPKVSPTGNIKVTYEAEDIGGAGLAEIILYYTTDGGLTWNMYGKDPDLTSPMEFRSERGGSYGFFLQAKDRVGNSTVAPRPGTRPELVTLIDNMPPKVELLSFNGGAYRGGDTQDIRWTAVDDNIAERPITIEYSVDGGNTWQVIARNEPNDGIFSWTLPQQTNSNRSLVRVTAVDALGNTGAAVSRAPFIIDSQAPRSRASFDLEGRTPGAVIVRPVQPAVPATPAPDAPVQPPGAAVEQELDQVEKWLAARDTAKLGEILGILDGIIIREPHNGRAYALRGWYYLAKSMYGEALTDLEKAASLRPQDGSIYLNLSKVHFFRSRTMAESDRGRAAEEAANAMRYAEKALSLPPDDPDEYLFSGLALVQMGEVGQGSRERYNTAATRLTAAVEKGRSAYSVGVACFWRGLAREKLGELAAAAADYDRAADSFGPLTEEGKSARERARALRATPARRTP